MLHKSTPRIPTDLFGKMGFKKPREEIQDARSEKILADWFGANVCFLFQFSIFYIKFNSNDLVFFLFRFLRSVAYREFIFMIHGYLVDERRVLPACAYNAIRSTFNEEKEQFKGFDDEPA